MSTKPCGKNYSAGVKEFCSTYWEPGPEGLIVALLLHRHRMGVFT